MPARQTAKPRQKKPSRAKPSARVPSVKQQQFVRGLARTLLSSKTKFAPHPTLQKTATATY